MEYYPQKLAKCQRAILPEGVVAADSKQPGHISRRDLMAVASGAMVLGPRDLLAPQVAQGQTAPAPGEPLRRLMEGNARYVAGTLTGFNEDLAVLKKRTAEKQQPFAAVLSCADSRVPVEIVFNQSIGHVFVCRVAGNIATPAIIGSLEFGTAVLGARLLMVLGHGGCGAVAAAMQNQAVPGQISGLYPYIRPAVDRAGTDLDAAVKANALFQARTLQEASPVIAGLVKQGRLSVVAAYYDLTTGKVSILHG
jgi:carbonic anhydrase